MDLGEDDLTFKGRLVKPLASVGLFFALTCVVAPSQTTLPERDAAAEQAAAKLISIVKQTPASQLDSTLPNIAFKEWLGKQVGKDSTINWCVSTGVGHGLPWVEADVSIQGRPGIVIVIANGRANGTPTKPRFRSLQLMRAEIVEWPNLRDLRTAITKAKE